ncbi:hypothetical protein IAG25_19290 [Caballeronia sp. EK]|uniref:hypothetical protein n=1 Tax=Caballeronia sp. EK TaxID=2767469 RepID=UPI001656384F|nr:hypothetical protein [Caballeronia sp. EK]MBC8638968.1 hypothetical protein [Caballeronia sp. EK]
MANQIAKRALGDKWRDTHCEFHCFPVKKSQSCFQYLSLKRQPFEFFECNAEDRSNDRNDRKVTRFVIDPVKQADFIRSDACDHQSSFYMRSPGTYLVDNSRKTQPATAGHAT